MTNDWAILFFAGYLELADEVKNKQTDFQALG